MHQSGNQAGAVQRANLARWTKRRPRKAGLGHHYFLGEFNLVATDFWEAGSMAGEVIKQTTEAASAPVIYARATPVFDERVDHALRLLVRAFEQSEGKLVFATSFGAEDQVLTDLISRNALALPIVTLDTGMLHRETMSLWEQTQRHYGMRIASYAADPGQVVAFVTLHGKDAMRKSVDLRKACCGLRKVEPLERALADKNAWITGMRREQSADRAGIEFFQKDERGRTKINPLADWTDGDVWNYIQRFQVPYNVLHDRFYPSIGCAPCTRAVALGEDPRAGRWWWENGSKECGLHTQGHSSGGPGHGSN
jgi:phosphoadenosine phosphosulfate reductase